MDFLFSEEITDHAIFSQLKDDEDIAGQRTSILDIEECLRTLQR